MRASSLLVALLLPASAVNGSLPVEQYDHPAVGPLHPAPVNVVAEERWESGERGDD